MSIVIVSNSASGTLHSRELRSAQPPAALATPASMVGSEGAPAGGSGRVEDYWRIPAVPDGDEDFLYKAPVPSQRPGEEAADSALAPSREGGSEWAPFDTVTVDDIARETPQTVVRLFSYSLW